MSRIPAPIAAKWSGSSSSSATLTSGDRVQIRLVKVSGGRLIPGTYESKADWYDPDRTTANFVVLSPGMAGYPGFTQERAVLATFGTPAGPTTSVPTPSWSGTVTC